MSKKIECEGNEKRLMRDKDIVALENKNNIVL
jgi:hypothetical protein